MFKYPNTDHYVNALSANVELLADDDEPTRGRARRGRSNPPVRGRSGSRASRAGSVGRSRSRGASRDARVGRGASRGASVGRSASRGPSRRNRGASRGPSQGISKGAGGRNKGKQGKGQQKKQQKQQKQKKKPKLQVRVKNETLDLINEQLRIIRGILQMSGKITLPKDAHEFMNNIKWSWIEDDMERLVGGYMNFDGVLGECRLNHHLPPWIFDFFYSNCRYAPAVGDSADFKRYMVIVTDVLEGRKYAQLETRHILQAFEFVLAESSYWLLKTLAGGARRKKLDGIYEQQLKSVEKNTDVIRGAHESGEEYLTNVARQALEGQDVLKSKKTVALVEPFMWRLVKDKVAGFSPEKRAKYMADRVHENALRFFVQSTAEASEGWKKTSRQDKQDKRRAEEDIRSQRDKKHGGLEPELEEEPVHRRGTGQNARTWGGRERPAWGTEASAERAAAPTAALKASAPEVLAGRAQAGLHLVSMRYQ